MIELIHPQDITDKKFEITEDDIMANLPFHPKASIWFDHHELTGSNVRPPEDFRGSHAIAPSVARVIYDYYNAAELKKYEYLVDETDRFDAAQLTMEDITDPKEVILLGFTIDSRTGIGSFKEYFESLVKGLRTMSLEEVLTQPDVQERIRLMKEQNAAFLALLKKSSSQDGNVVVTDFRSVEKISVGNRFLIYTLFPDTNVSVRLQWGPGKQSVAVTLGHNIFNRTSSSNCGHICSDFGGGGHRGAGACPLQPDKADQQITEIIQRLKSDT
jgi:nanoRNase/pAp phosphatase (c-di-AMP/oligoRNAs hydrolase)